MSPHIPHTTTFQCNTEDSISTIYPSSIIVLDAFQGPYKDKFYYRTGLQLSLRAVFFGVSVWIGVKT